MAIVWTGLEQPYCMLLRDSIAGCNLQQSSLEEVAASEGECMLRCRAPCQCAPVIIGMFEKHASQRALLAAPGAEDTPRRRGGLCVMGVHHHHDARYLHHQLSELARCQDGLVPSMDTSSSYSVALIM